MEEKDIGKIDDPGITSSRDSSVLLNEEELQENIRNLSEAERYIGFFAGENRCALSLKHVIEIGNTPKTTFLPNVPGWVNGVFNFRGEIVSAIGFSSFFEISRPTNKNLEKMILVKSLDNDISTALLVDSTIRVFNVFDEDINETKGYPDSKLKEYISGTFNYEQNIIGIFDIEKYLTSTEVTQFN